MCVGRRGRRSVSRELMKRVVILLPGVMKGNTSAGLVSPSLPGSTDSSRLEVSEPPQVVRAACQVSLSAGAL